MDQFKLKVILRIMNLFITILSIVSIAAYFVYPLWKVEAEVKFTQELVTFMNEKIDEGTDPENESEETQTIKDVLQSFADNNVSFGLKIELFSYEFINALVTQDSKPVESIIEKNLDGVLDGLTDDIKAAMKPAIKAVVKVTIKNKVKDTLTQNATEEYNVADVLEDIGVTDDYIDQKVDGIMESLFSEDATVDTVTEEVITVVDEVLDKLSDAETYKENVSALSEEQRAEIHEQVENVVNKVLGVLADDEGNINVEDFVSDLLIGALNGENVLENLSKKLDIKGKDGEDPENAHTEEDGEGLIPDLVAYANES
ncbi:MAG: hypothetical protein J5903_04025, partial [Clostridia bacterium]|nr:hypothetical protein [Clostridia bacterium]